MEGRGWLVGCVGQFGVQIAGTGFFVGGTFFSASVAFFWRLGIAELRVVGVLEGLVGGKALGIGGKRCSWCGRDEGWGISVLGGGVTLGSNVRGSGRVHVTMAPARGFLLGGGWCWKDGWRFIELPVILPHRPCGVNTQVLWGGRGYVRVVPPGTTRHGTWLPWYAAARVRSRKLPGVAGKSWRLFLQGMVEHGG